MTKYTIPFFDKQGSHEYTIQLVDNGRGVMVRYGDKILVMKTHWFIKVLQAETHPAWHGWNAFHDNVTIEDVQGVPELNNDKEDDGA